MENNGDIMQTFDELIKATKHMKKVLHEANKQNSKTVKEMKN